MQHVHRERCDLGEGQYLHYLVAAAPEVLWFDVQDVGSYQGMVFGVFLYLGRVFVYEDSYGSCSGCGAWSEGVNPTSLEEIVKKSKEFASEGAALDYIHKFESYESPDRERLKRAVSSAFAWGVFKLNESDLQWFIK